MIVYRPFLNSDPPHIAEIWRSQAPERGLAQPMSVPLLEQAVFAKPYFDREGMIVAVDDERKRPIGFAHAAFGSSDDECRLSHVLGTTLLIMVRQDYQGRGIAAELLSRSEAYLQIRGAKVLYAGGMRPLNAFYIGLYGGSELPGVLVSSHRAHDLFRAAGYREIDRTSVQQIELSGFRPPVDRVQIQHRRSYSVKMIADPCPRSWWEACTFGSFDRLRFELTTRQSSVGLGSCTVWNLQPLASSWGVSAAGLLDLEVAEHLQNRGVGTFLISEVLRELANQGIGLVEAQTMVHNTSALRLYAKLGFREVDQGLVYRKEMQ